MRSDSTDRRTQQFYDELSEPEQDARIPTLDDYVPVLAELAREREALIAGLERMPTHDKPKPAANTLLADTHVVSKAQPVIPIRWVNTSEPDTNAFLHYNATTGAWVVQSERFPLQGFTLMRAPTGERGYVFETFVQDALRLGAHIDDDSQPA